MQDVHVTYAVACYSTNDTHTRCDSQLCYSTNDTHTHTVILNSA
jgi:hypothetical protein